MKEFEKEKTLAKIAVMAIVFGFAVGYAASLSAGILTSLLIMYGSQIQYNQKLLEKQNYVLQSQHTQLIKELRKK